MFVVSPPATVEWDWLFITRAWIQQGKYVFGLFLVKLLWARASVDPCNKVLTERFKVMIQSEREAGIPNHHRGRKDNGTISSMRTSQEIHSIVGVTSEK